MDIGILWLYCNVKVLVLLGLFFWCGCSEGVGICGR